MKCPFHIIKWNVYFIYITEGNPVNERILISGASIAGLTLASWLARHGLRPTVVERAPALRAGGNGVDVRDQAVTVAERMGIMEDVRAAAADVRGMKFVDADDRAVARVAVGEPGAVEIMRGDLVALLRGTADVEYLFDDSVRRLDQDDDGVTVTFENAPARRFDLVVGADGMHSTVRRLAFGPEERFVRFRGHYFAFADADASLGEDRWVTMYNRPGRMAGIYRSGNHAQAKAYFVFRSARPAYDPRDLAQHRRLLREAFAERHVLAHEGAARRRPRRPGLLFRRPRPGAHGLLVDGPGGADG